MKSLGEPLKTTSRLATALERDHLEAALRGEYDLECFLHGVMMGIHALSARKGERWYGYPRWKKIKRTDDLPMREEGPQAVVAYEYISGQPD